MSVSHKKLRLKTNNFMDPGVISEHSSKSDRVVTKKPALISNDGNPDSSKRSSSPKNEQAKAAAIITERQVKYLGLVIEKDEEQLIEINDELFMPKDPVKRQYVPIRERYIKIVKKCRTLTIESLEKRGRKDMRKTAKNLFRIAKSIGRNSARNNGF